MSRSEHIEKDLRRADVQESADVPDEVLRQMIREIEDGGMLRAPGYLKREILDAAEKSDAARVPEAIPSERLSSAEMQEHERHAFKTRTGAKTSARNKRRNRIVRKLEWIGYALEVGAVTAAAVALVFMMPDDDRLLWERREAQAESEWDFRYDGQWEQENKVRQQISDATSNLARKIVTWGNFLLPGKEEDMR